MSLPSDEDVERALEFMRDNEGAFAEMKARETAAKEYMKVAMSSEYLRLEGKGGVSDREHMARASEAYANAIKHHTAMQTDRERMALRYKRAEMVIEVWRTLSANQRRGV